MMVARVLTESARKFIDNVLALNLRHAVFDCDGTLWSGDAGADFFFYEIERGLIPADAAKRILARYEQYKAGTVDELSICGEMVTIHQGIAEKDIRALASELFRTVIEPRIFPEMLELTHRLTAADCKVWAVSSTNNWAIEEAMPRFAIPQERVIAACVEIENCCATDRLLRVPTDELKATAIQELIGREVDAVFGNSIHDLAMLEITPHPFAINPNPDLEKIARERGWTVYQPTHD
ncbi:MAG: haloacid dehalogenase-like hydrolase [Candidatus Korobacteraceae bacterium]